MSEPITPAAMRAARYLLGMSIRQLADTTGFSKDTLGPFERGARDISFRSKRDLRNALEDLGIHFSIGESKDEERVELADGWSISRPRSK